jgi:hypothetical protein
MHGILHSLVLLRLSLLSPSHMMNRRASTPSHMMNRRASMFNQPSSALPINFPISASTSSGSPLPQSTGITFIPRITQRRPRPRQKDL